MESDLKVSIRSKSGFKVNMVWGHVLPQARHIGPVVAELAVTSMIGTARRDLLEAEGRGGTNFGPPTILREIPHDQARFRGVSPRIGM